MYFSICFVVKQNMNLLAVSTWNLLPSLFKFLQILLSLVSVYQSKFYHPADNEVLLPIIPQIQPQKSSNVHHKHIPNPSYYSLWVAILNFINELWKKNLPSLPNKCALVVFLLRKYIETNPEQDVHIQVPFYLQSCQKQWTIWYTTWQKN